MLLLIETPTGCVRECHAGPLRRLLTRLLSVHLTERLAGGASPDSSVLLTLRSGELIHPAHRHGLAERLFDLLDDSVGAARNPCADLVDWVGVRRARWEIGALAATLDAPGPVAVRGVARAEQLLTDGGGPLFSRDDPDGLARAARAATLELDLWP